MKTAMRAKGARMFFLRLFAFKVEKVITSPRFLLSQLIDTAALLQKETAKSGSFASVLHLVPLVVG